jgi:hypothetical protein
VERERRHLATASHCGGLAGSIERERLVRLTAGSALASGRGRGRRSEGSLPSPRWSSIAEAERMSASGMQYSVGREGGLNGGGTR